MHDTNGKQERHGGTFAPLPSPPLLLPLLSLAPIPRLNSVKSYPILSITQRDRLSSPT